MAAPCPVPRSGTSIHPSSRTPARSHFWIRRRTRLSPMRCSRNRASHSHRVEELRNVSVDNVIHLPGVNGRRQGVERVVRSPPRPESVAEAEEVFLVDRIQHVGHGALNDLVLQRRHRQRPLAAVRFGYVNPPARRRPIRPALDSVMQVRELTLEVCFVVPPRYSVDPGGRVLGYRIERVPQSFRCDVVQERGELLVAPCSYPYAIPRL